jgi:hypothetical protein
MDYTLLFAYYTIAYLVSSDVLNLQTTIDVFRYLLVAYRTAIR